MSHSYKLNHDIFIGFYCIDQLLNYMQEMDFKVKTFRLKNFMKIRKNKCDTLCVEL